MKNKTILVTGAAGFIGFHLAQKLNARGDFVIGLDNFNEYYTPLLKRKRADMLKNLGIEVFEGDICNTSLLKELFENQQFTHVVHLAAQAGVRYAQKRPDAYLKSNLEGFLSILECCKHFPAVKLVYASSSSVYGTNEKIPFSITDRTDHPANLYAATKKANELMAYSYHHLYSIKMVGLRYFTVYGPWGRPDMAYFHFTDAIEKGKPIELFDRGQMERDFTYIDDAVEGTVAALDCESTFEVFNIGNNAPASVITLVETLEKLLNKKAIKIEAKPMLGEVKTTFADIEYSTQRLKFLPKTTLEKGLKAFVEWYQSFKDVWERGDDIGGHHRI